MRRRGAGRRADVAEPRVTAIRKKVIITDRMQRGYVYWRTEPVGRNFAPGFKPDLTPKEMLRLGIFGGKYMTDCQEEFPRSWFARARLCAERHDARLNCFGVNASQSLAVWRRSGWIHKQDPRGWFQWYCRYYMGRRTADDARQIRRWRAIARHVAAIRNHCERAISNVGGASGRPSFTGRTTAERYKEGFRLRVFLTGATGFIGRALIPRLQRDGHAVVAWVRSPARARVSWAQRSSWFPPTRGPTYWSRD